MDDGQRRAFKVKFEGEGVDDYGGPYREVFSHVCEELQAMRLDEKGADGHSDGERQQCTLPLFAPCPNRVAGTGENRERLVINPSSACADVSGGSQLLFEMFGFIGQLMGISIRCNAHMNIPLSSIIWKTVGFCIRF